VGFSRLYNGDHSMDQILYGWLLGLWSAISLHLLVRDHLISHIKSLLYRTQQYTNGDLSTFYLISSLIFLATLAMLCVTFYVIDSDFSIPIDWRQRLINKCSASVTFFSFTNASLIEGGSAAILFGGYLGIVNLYESGNTFQPLDINDICSVIKKFAVGVPLLLPFVLPAIFVIGTSNAYLALIFYTTIPTLGAGFVVFGFMDRMADYLCGGSKQAARRKADNNKNQSYLELKDVKLVLLK
jgi:hypothetical protein